MPLDAPSARWNTKDSCVTVVALASTKQPSRIYYEREGHATAVPTLSGFIWLPEFSNPPHCTYKLVDQISHHKVEDLFRVEPDY